MLKALSQSQIPRTFRFKAVPFLIRKQQMANKVSKISNKMGNSGSLAVTTMCLTLTNILKTRDKKLKT